MNEKIHKQIKGIEQKMQARAVRMKNDQQAMEDDRILIDKLRKQCEGGTTELNSEAPA